jgi:glucosamine-phosphate N-acetyltransferase
MQYITRKLKKTDMKIVVDLLQQISNFKPKVEIYDSIWKKFISQKYSYALVIEINNAIVGYGCLSYSMNLRGGKIAYVEDIVCDKSFKRKGIGKAIMQKLYDYAKKKNCYKLVLQCKEENKKFYEKCGYKENGFCMQKLI